MGSQSGSTNVGQAGRQHGTAEAVPLQNKLESSFLRPVRPSPFQITFMGRS